MVNSISIDFNQLDNNICSLVNVLVDFYPRYLYCHYSFIPITVSNKNLVPFHDENTRLLTQPLIRTHTNTCAL